MTARPNLLMFINFRQLSSFMQSAVINRRLPEKELPLALVSSRRRCVFYCNNCTCNKNESRERALRTGLSYAHSLAGIFDLRYLWYWNFIRQGCISERSKQIKLFDRCDRQPPRPLDRHPPWSKRISISPTLVAPVSVNLVVRQIFASFTPQSSWILPPLAKSALLYSHRYARAPVSLRGIFVLGDLSSCLWIP
jgi:hypothetical protein